MRLNTRSRVSILLGVVSAAWFLPGVMIADTFSYDGESAARLLVSPPQTEVYVDGEPAGIADDFDGFTQRLRVAPGPHELELFLPGHRTIRERVLFAPGQTYKIRHVMEPLASGEPEPRRPGSSGAPATPPPPPEPRRSDYGTLTISVRPGPATVWIDGERWDALEGAALEVQLAEGRHRVEIEKPGRAPYATTVRVLDGETTTLNVSLAERQGER